MTIHHAHTDPGREALRRRTMAWVLALATLGLVFDGYDLVVYGTVVSVFLRHPTEIGTITPSVAGAMGSYALIGTLIGALLAGSISDIIGRRTVMLTGYAWFSICMGITALATDSTLFGLGRFLTGIGVGALVATTGALVSEFAPRGRKNLCNAVAYSGVPLGSLLAALLAILLLGGIGWRGLFWIGVIPLFTLFPLAVWRMPESVAWLVSRGRIEDAQRVAAATGMPTGEVPAATSSESRRSAPAPADPGGRAGYAGLFDRDNRLPAVLFGLACVATLLLVYSLNTWLPELMLRAGFDTTGSLQFLLVLNGGAIIGALLGSRVADRVGPKVVTTLFLLTGGVFVAALSTGVPLALLLVFVGAAGLGTSGTQILLNGFAVNYFRINVRAAAVGWLAGFGRLGGVAGPLVGGLLLAAGLDVRQIFLLLAAVAGVGVGLLLLVPDRNRPPGRRPGTTAGSSGETADPHLRVASFPADHGPASDRRSRS